MSDRLGAYPIGYVPDGPLKRGALYRTKNNRVRMYPPGTSVYQQNKARKRWEAERMEIYEEHKFEWLDAFLSRGSLPYINDSLKFNHYPPSYSESKQAWVWVYHKFLDDKEIINKLINEKGYIHIESGLGDCFTRHCSSR